MIKKRRWLTFLLAMIPGVGHLYLGYKKQGLMFMMGASIFIICTTSEPMIFPFALAALWFYQLFDALQKAALMKLAAAEHERMMFQPDAFGAPWSMDFQGMPGVPRDDVNPAWIGIGCVVGGALLLLITAFPGLWELLSEINFGTILLSLALIGYGLKLLRNNTRV